jgi:hypothetical protein
VAAASSAADGLSVAGAPLGVATAGEPLAAAAASAERRVAGAVVAGVPAESDSSS